MSSIYDFSFPQPNPDEPSWILDNPVEAVETLGPMFSSASSDPAYLVNLATFLSNFIGVLF